MLLNRNGFWWIVLMLLGITWGCRSGFLSIRQEAIQLYQVSGSIYRNVMTPYLQKGDPSKQEGLSLSDSSKKELSEALILCQRAIDLDPLLPPPHKLAIDLSMLLKNDALVLSLFDRAVLLFPDDINLRMVYIRYLTTKDTIPQDRVRRLMDDGLIRSPTAAPLRMMRAQICLNSDKEHGKAADDLLDILKGSQPLSVQAYSQVALMSFILWEKNLKEGAAQLVKILCKRSPEGVKAALPFVLADQKSAENAENLFGLTRELYAVPSSFHPIWARILIHRRKFAEAEVLMEEEAFEGHCKASDEPESLSILLALVAMEKKKSQDAAKILESVLDRSPCSIDALEAYFKLYAYFTDQIQKEEILFRLKKAIQSTNNPVLRMGLSRRIDMVMKQPKGQDNPLYPPK